MTTNAATESKLGDLHSKIATVMTKALDTVEKAQDAYLEADADDVGPMPEVSAPLLGVMVKFLNDNKISCVVDENAAMNELAQTLEEKRKARRKRVGNVVHLDQSE